MAIEDVMEKFVSAFEKLTALVERQQVSLNEHAREIAALKIRLEMREKDLARLLPPNLSTCSECEGKDCNCNGCGGFGR